MANISNLMDGIASAGHPRGLLIILIGVALGIFIGALPGLGPTVGIAVALPIVIRFPPEESIWLLMGIVIGAGFGNSITAILLGIPGTPSAILTALESEAFRRNGTELRALTLALTSSFLGQLVAVVAFVVMIIPLARVALAFLHPEIFALTLFALCAVIGLSEGRPSKGLAGAGLGFAVALVGADPMTGQLRFDTGMSEFYGGIPVIPALIGLLAFREVFAASRRAGYVAAQPGRRRGLQWPRWRWVADSIHHLGATTTGTTAGIVVGALPGAGPSVATFVTYGLLQMNRRIRRQLGRGSLDGIAGVDAAQNAAGTSALIPTLALGVPGSAPMVIIMGLLVTRGIYPGPQFVSTEPELLQAIFGGLLIACPMLLLVGFLFIGPAEYVTKLSHPSVVASSLILMMTGVYSIRWSLVDVTVSVVLGAIGYAMWRYQYPIAPAALALILAPIMEASLRRGLHMAGSGVEFITRPITGVLLVLSAGLLLFGLRRSKDSEDAPEIEVVN